MSKNKILSTLLTIILALNIASIFFVTNVSSYGETGTEMALVNPTSGNSNFIYYTDLTPVGSTFVANVSIYNVTDCTGWQLNITWDPTHIDLLSLAKPADHMFATEPIFEGPATIDHTAGTLSVLPWLALGIGGTAQSAGATGRRILQLTFQIVAAPGPYSYFTSDIHIVVEGEATFYTKLEPALTFGTHDGNYTYIWQPPSTLPKLSVVPNYVELGGGAPIVGTSGALFSVDVRISNLDAGWRLIGVQFKITGYNTTLLDVLGATEGPFMASFAPPSTSPATYFIFHDDGTELIFGIIINNYTAMTTYPSGSGTLATINFEAIYEDQFPWYDTCPINIEPLYGYWGIDPDLVYIDFQAPGNGLYRINGYILGRNIDVYTQYPDPYGGQGINQTSDMFWPQKDVILKANVTYNLDPVQSKLVTFEVTSPTGLHHFVFTAFSDENGVATVEFGLPWPCVDPEAEIFGIWEVIVSVDIRCEVVFDYLWFKVWWRVEITDVIPKAAEFNKGEIACFDVFFRTYSEQPFWTLITLTVLDDLNVPVGSAYVWVYVGEEHEWCTFVEYNVTLCVYLPKWAFVGTGTVKVNALSDWPSYGGSAYSPEASAEFTILRPL